MTDHARILAHLFIRVSQSELARELGISRQAVHKWQRVPRKQLRRVAEISGMPAETLRPDLDP